MPHPLVRNGIIPGLVVSKLDDRYIVDGLV
jgi:hypothetical protein